MIKHLVSMDSNTLEISPFTAHLNLLYLYFYHPPPHPDTHTSNQPQTPSLVYISAPHDHVPVWSTHPDVQVTHQSTPNKLSGCRNTLILPDTSQTNLNRSAGKSTPVKTTLLLTKYSQALIHTHAGAVRYTHTGPVGDRCPEQLYPFTAIHKYVPAGMHTHMSKHS